MEYYLIVCSKQYIYSTHTLFDEYGGYPSELIIFLFFYKVKCLLII